MARLSDHTIFLAQSDTGQEKLMRGAMVAVGMSVNVLNHEQSLPAQIEALRYAQHAHPVLVVDLASLAAEGNGPDVVLMHLNERFPKLRVIATLSDRLVIFPDEAAWVKSYRAAGLFPQASHLRIEETLCPLLAMIVNDSDAVLDVEKISTTLRVLNAEIEQMPVMAEAHATLIKLKAIGMPLEKLLAAISETGGFDVRPRSYRLKHYGNCFVGSEAVDVLMRITGRSRATSCAIGRLLHTMGIFYHVAREHGFEDANFFYRFSLPTDHLRALNLKDVVFAIRGRGGFKVKDRTYRGKSFPHCFVGSEAAAWLQEKFELTQTESISLGQTLLRLHVIRHVVDDHEFIDQNYFYRFA